MARFSSGVLPGTVESGSRETGDGDREVRYHVAMVMTTQAGRRSHASMRSATLLLVLLTSQAAAAQVPLPEGAGKDQMVKVCGLCHEPQRAASIRLTRDGWEATIGDMIARGAKATDEEFQAILDYLSTHFLGEAERPLNVNTATAIDLESVLLLLRKEAAALIAYREKNGLFKSVEDLKKVPGIDVKKIEAQKDRLYFGGVAPSAPKDPPKDRG
jgi:competence protein ComEA